MSKRMFGGRQLSFSCPAGIKTISLLIYGSSFHSHHVSDTFRQKKPYGGREWKCMLGSGGRI